MMNRARSGRIIIQMAVIIGVGFGIGVVDSIVRPINLSKRSAPPPISIPAAKPSTGESSPPPNTAPAAGTPSKSTGGVETSATQPKTPPESAPAATSAPVGADKPFVQTPKDALPEGQITIDEAKFLYDEGLKDNNTFFVDARKLEDFVKGHVVNAIRMDTAMFQIKEPDELGLIPRSAKVVVYCNGGHCDESENVAKRLDGSGYKQVYVMHDGFPGWKSLGHPVATGE